MDSSNGVKFSIQSEPSQLSLCRSCEKNYSDTENPSPLGRQRMTSHSICESLISTPYDNFQKQYAEVVLSYHKLKISFTVMLVLNAILLVVVIACMVFIIPHISSKPKDESTETVPYAPKTGEIRGNPPPQTTTQTNTAMDVSNMVYCKTIQEKLGAVYNNGQKMVEIGTKMCSLGDMMESVVQGMKKESHTSKTKAAFHFTASYSPLTGCRSGRTLKCLRNWEVKMKTTDVQINGEKIIVPKSGIYFLYNRVSVSMNVSGSNNPGDILHSLQHSSSGKNFKNIESTKIACQINNNQFNHVSYIEKVEHLRSGDELQIALKTPLRTGMGTVQSSSSFGMFEL